MRHVNGVLIGLGGVLAGLLVTGYGYGLAYEALTRMRLESMPAAAGMLLLGGLVLGGVILGARVSPAAPLTAAAVLVLASLYGMFDPMAVFDLGRGLGYVVSSQVGMILAGMLVVAAFAVRRPARTPAAGPPAPAWAAQAGRPAPPASGPVVH